MVTERQLRQRLARVEALERGASTEGERQAAEHARHRLMNRIAKVRGQDPVVQFVAADLKSLGVPGERPPPPPSLPSERELLLRLREWEAGDRFTDDLQNWAEDIVDRVVLHTDPSHPQAAIGEVLLQLAMMHRVPLQEGAADAVEAFLTSRDWQGWFEWVASQPRRFR